MLPLRPGVPVGESWLAPGVMHAPGVMTPYPLHYLVHPPEISAVDLAPPQKRARLHDAEVSLGRSAAHHVAMAGHAVPGFMAHGYAPYTTVVNHAEAGVRTPSPIYTEAPLRHVAGALSKAGWTDEEDRTVLAAVRLLGTQWPVVADRLPGRTADAVRPRLRHYSGSFPPSRPTSPG